MQSADAGTMDDVQRVGPSSPMTLFCEGGLCHMFHSAATHGFLLERIRLLGPPSHSAFRIPHCTPTPTPTPTTTTTTTTTTTAPSNNMTSYLTTTIMASRAARHLRPYQPSSSCFPIHSPRLFRNPSLLRLRSMASSTLFSTGLIVAFRWTSRSSANQVS